MTQKQPQKQPEVQPEANWLAALAWWLVAALAAILVLPYAVPAVAESLAGLAVMLVTEPAMLVVLAAAVLFTWAWNPPRRR